MTNHTHTPSNIPIWVRAAAQISMQQPLCDDWMTHPIGCDSPYMRALDPGFKAFIAPAEARRLGRVLKRALATSLSALAEAEVTVPDAIVTGTGLGSVESTDLFLKDLCEQGEELLSPTHFMQSTHNTIGSLIAIRLHAHGYNTTYAHKGISFESALLDAALQLSEGRIETALVGGHDGLTPSYYTLLNRIGYVGQPGMVPAGEVAACTVLQRGEAGAPPVGHVLCRMEGIKMLYRPTPAERQAALDDLLCEAGTTIDEIDAVLTGINGQEALDASYVETAATLCPNRPLLHYKHLFGESYSAPAIAFYVAARCLERGVIPTTLYYDPTTPALTPPRRLLLWNMAEGRHTTFILLSSCGNS